MKYTTITFCFIIVSNLSQAHASNLTSLLKKSRVEMGGWVNGGATYNANNP